jgi:hypothetical protein
MKRTFGGALLAASWLLNSAFADSPTYEVTIAAGAHHRKNVPVHISLPPVALPAKPVAVILTDPDGKTIPAQLTEPGLLASKECWREAHFILPILQAGESLRLQTTLSSESPPRSESFSWHDRPGQSTELRFGKRPVLRYHYSAYDESSKESH